MDYTLLNTYVTVRFTSVMSQRARLTCINTFSSKWLEKIVLLQAVMAKRHLENRRSLAWDLGKMKHVSK